MIYTGNSVRKSYLYISKLCKGELYMSDAVLRLKRIEALKDVANGNSTKIFIPNDLVGVLSGIDVIGESLGI